MDKSAKHTVEPAVESERVATFADSLSALASDLREADVVAAEIQELSAVLSSHASQMADAVAETEAPARKVPILWAKTALGRVAAVAATLAIGTGGLGVAGALPAPIQDAFDATVEAIESTVFGGEEAPTSPQSSLSTQPSAEVSLVRGSVPSESQATTPTPDLDAPLDEEDPSVGDEHRSPTAANVADVKAAYDKETSEVSLGKLVSAVASEGKAGGAAAERQSAKEPKGKTTAPGQEKKVAVAETYPPELLTPTD